MPVIAVTRKSLGKPIVNAPVAGDPPRLNGIFGPSNSDFFKGFVPVFRDVGPRGLNRAQFVRAARHQRTLFSVPLPVVAKSRVRHWIRWCSKVGILPAQTAVGGYLHTAYGTRAGP